MGRLFIVIGSVIAAILIADSVMHDPDVHPFVSSVIQRVESWQNSMGAKVGAEERLLTCHSEDADWTGLVVELPRRDANVGDVVTGSNHDLTVLVIVQNVTPSGRIRQVDLLGSLPLTGAVLGNGEVREFVAIDPAETMARAVRTKERSPFRDLQVCYVGEEPETAASPVAVPTELPNLTPDATETPVLTETASPTETPEPTLTNTVAPTETTAPTNTPEPTLTSTVAPTETTAPTNTPEPTLTSTVAPTETTAPTLTNTVAPTETATPTNTPDPTLTSTVAPTETATPTETPEPTLTNTIAPTETTAPSNTPEPTLTNTVAPTETAVPTETPQPTETNTVVPTATTAPTETPEPTLTNTVSPTETVAPTETPEPSPTNTVAPTETAAPTETTIPSVTPEPTQTNTVAPTETMIPTETPEPTLTNSVAPTETVVPTETPEPTQTPEPMATNTAAPTETPVPTSTLAPAPTLTDSAASPAPTSQPGSPVAQPSPSDVAASPTAMAATATATPFFSASDTASFDAWTVPEGWSANGALVTDGVQESAEWVAPPVTVTTTNDYGVEFTFTLSETDVCPRSFGVAIRGTSDGYIAGGIEWNCDASALIWIGQDPVATTAIDLTEGPHTLRLQAVGPQITLLLDGTVVAEATSDQVQQGSIVAFWSTGVPVAIESVQILDLSDQAGEENDE